MNADALRALLMVSAVAVAVSALVVLLPSPREVFSAEVTVGLSAQIDRGALIVATVLTWALALWLAGVLLMIVAARLARGSRFAQQVVTRSAQMLLPRTLRGLMITAVGVGSLTAMAGCAPTTTTAGLTVAVGADRPTAPDSSTITDSSGLPDSSFVASTGVPALPLVWDWPTDPFPASAGPAEAGPTGTGTPTDGTGGPDSPAAAEPVSPSPAASIDGPSPDGAPGTTPAPGAVSTSIAETPAPESAPVIAPAPASEGVMAPEQAPAEVPAERPAEAATEVPVDAVGATADTPAPQPVAAPLPAPPAAAAATATADPGPNPVTVEPGPAVPTDRTVTVAPGDSLWSIAAAHLPAGATDADIATAWPRWFDANRALIGTDPGQIQPGWQLTVPTDSQDLRP